MSLHELLRVVDAEAFGMGGDTFQYGNKVLLPGQILSQLMAMDAPSPFMFIVRQADGRIGETHETTCGVKEFTMPEGTCALPQWMLNSLGLQYGDSAHFRIARFLPVCTECDVQAQNSEYAKGVRDAQRTFEMALQGNYNALTVGDSISLRVGAQSHIFHIRRLQPANSCSLIDAELKISFLPPVEKEPERFRLGHAEVAEGEVKAGGDVLYHFTVEEGEARNVLVAVEAVSGDPDIYVARHQSPSPTNFTWEGTGKGSTCVVITPDHPRFTAGVYNVCIHGHKADSKFRIVFCMTQKTPQELLQLSGQYGEMDLYASVELVPDGHVMCDHCRRPVPEQNYEMHSLRCERQNWRCPTCKKVMSVKEKETHWHCPTCNLARDPKVHGHCGVCGKSVRQTELEKHMEIYHVMRSCKCGREFELAQLLVHQEFECQLRAERCCYCDQDVASVELADHEAFCGGRTISCSDCGALVSNRDRQTHRLMHHHPSDDSAVPGGSARTRADPDFDRIFDAGSSGTAPWTSGSENFGLEASLDSSLFSCPFCHESCGDFDSLSVHMQTRH